MSDMVYSVRLIHNDGREFACQSDENFTMAVNNIILSLANYSEYYRNVINLTNCSSRPYQNVISFYEKQHYKFVKSFKSPWGVFLCFRAGPTKRERDACLPQSLEPVA